MDERIESYFDSTMDEQQKSRFEKDMDQSPELLDEIAFYLQARISVQDGSGTTTLQEKHREWTSIPAAKPDRFGLFTGIGIAAAILVILGLYFLNNNLSPGLPQQASVYLAQNFTSLPVQLGNRDDQLQAAILQYNESGYAAAQQSADAYLQHHPNDPEGLKIRGFANLQLKHFDEAIADFNRITVQKELYQNPGKFYAAISHLLRNQPGDERKAKGLLEEIIRENQTGKAKALEWLYRP
ncbi:hypothetical protein [Pedobacter hartonius]|uniref:Tetratricopeptide repeat-containing protein n=1 Tax=Pedobacter hartonius TaxID=425514 RepID=A0A1H4BRJ1_9SPHI|nr:hypothetical protein [Pedobacter hartonius]SEA50724.1 hypothetical protein SAMN05443550_103444 [Pedobacter hartonius]